MSQTLAIYIQLCFTLCILSSYLTRSNAFTCNSVRPETPGIAKRIPFSRIFSIQTTTIDHTRVLDDHGGNISQIKTFSGQTVILLGTNHLSQKSHQQVTEVIEQIQPQSIMIELDSSRLKKFGIPNKNSIRLKEIVTSSDINLVNKDWTNEATGLNPKKASLSRKWSPKKIIFSIMQQVTYLVVTEFFSRIIHCLLVRMYDGLTQHKNRNLSETTPAGGEFLAAIRAAERIPSCHTLILGDRSAFATIKRAVSLAIASGNPLRVLARFHEITNHEMEKLQRHVIHTSAQTLPMASHTRNENDVSILSKDDLKAAMLEAMKEDKDFRSRLIGKLEREVPEFCQAVLKDRDYIMAQAMGRELKKKDESGKLKTQRLVAVLGVGHLAGVQHNLERILG